MEKSKGQVKDKQRRDAAHSTIAEGKPKFESGDDGWREPAREYGIEIILNRIRSDLDLRKRVRKLLAELPADSPGKTSSIPEKFIIKAVETACCIRSFIRRSLSTTFTRGCDGRSDTASILPLKKGRGEVVTISRICHLAH